MFLFFLKWPRPSFPEFWRKAASGNIWSSFLKNKLSFLILLWCPLYPQWKQAHVNEWILPRCDLVPLWGHWSNWGLSWCNVIRTSKWRARGKGDFAFSSDIYLIESRFPPRNCTRSFPYYLIQRLAATFQGLRNLKFVIHERKEIVLFTFSCPDL